MRCHRRWGHPLWPTRPPQFQFGLSKLNGLAFTRKSLRGSGWPASVSPRWSLRNVAPKVADLVVPHPSGCTTPVAGLALLMWSRIRVFPLLQSSLTLGMLSRTGVRGLTPPVGSSPAALGPSPGGGRLSHLLCHSPRDRRLGPWRQLHYLRNAHSW